MSEQNALSEDLLAAAEELEAQAERAFTSNVLLEFGTARGKTADKLRRQAALIRSLVAEHEPRHISVESDPERFQCRGCRREWPCPTLRHLADAFLAARSAVSS